MRHGEKKYVFMSASAGLIENWDRGSLLGATDEEALKHATS